jgi:hypothetical protein
MHFSLFYILKLRSCIHLMLLHVHNKDSFVNDFPFINALVCVCVCEIKVERSHIILNNFLINAKRVTAKWRSLLIYAWIFLLLLAHLQHIIIFSTACTGKLWTFLLIFYCHHNSGIGKLINTHKFMSVFTCDVGQIFFLFALA